MDETQKIKIRPFLQKALDTDPLDRTFMQKLAVGIYGPGIEAREDANKPSAVLDDAYSDFVLELPAEVQADVDRYLNIFRNDPTPVIQFLDEYKKEGYNLFAGMMGSIHTEFLQKAMRVVITTETEEEYQRRLEARRARQQKLAQESAPTQSTSDDAGSQSPQAKGKPGGKPQGNRAQRRRQAALEKKQGRGARSA